MHMVCADWHDVREVVPRKQDCPLPPPPVLLAHRCARGGDARGVGALCAHADPEAEEMHICIRSLL
jgi:hypothetical protein